MRIFDFTNGVKGRELGTSKIFESLGGGRTSKKTGRVEALEVSNCIFHEDMSIYIGDGMNGIYKEVKPEDYGVEAICFCEGKIYGKWSWHFLATDKWLKENGYLDGYELNRNKEL